MIHAQTAFNTLVSKDFSQAMLEDVKVVALAMWYENFVPVVSHLSKRSAAYAGYVVNRLVRFNCVSADLKSKLRGVLVSLKKLASATPRY